MEASSFTEGTEQSFMSSSEVQPGAEDKDEENRKRFLVVCCALLLLLLLLGLYLGWPDAEREEDDGAAKTDAPQYKPGGGPPPKSEATTGGTASEETDVGGTTASTAKATTVATTTKATTTTTTTRTPSTGYGYLVCTTGRGGHEAAAFPVKEELCDFIVFTHVFAYNGSIVTDTGRLSYRKFIEIATLYRADKRTRFGLSHSPRVLAAQLAQGHDPGNASWHFLHALKTLPGNLSLSALGVMGLARKVNDLKHTPDLATWYKTKQPFKRKKNMFIDIYRC
ncbi:uncharacterized protein LOC144127747 [Amblyomma americanum]